MGEGLRHLALEKYTEDWYYCNPNDDPFDFSKRTICEDVSKLSDKQLEKLLDGMHRELTPEDYEEEDETSG